MSRNAPQLPTNSSTANAVVVPTTTGFTAGDVVYRQNNDYVSPSVTPSAFANPVGSLTFNADQTVPLPIPTKGNGSVNPVFGSASVSGYNFGSSNSKSSAVLTNGNIVQVWRQISSAATGANQNYFQIISPSGTLVVAPTSISATYTNSSSSNVTVAALAGGNFAVLFVNQSGGTTGKPTWAIYSNTGSIIVGATNDTSFGATSNYLARPSILALPNGNFVMAVGATSSSAVYIKIVGPTGTVILAWAISGVTAVAQYAPIAMAARSSSEFLMATLGGSGVVYAIYSASGAFVSGPSTYATSAVVSPTTGYSIDATILADGTTFILAFAGCSSSGYNSGTAWVPIPSSNTVGTAISIPGANLNTNSSGNSGATFVSVLGLAAGGYVVAFTDTTGTIKYAFFDAAGVAQSGTNTNGTLPLIIQGTCVYGYTGVTLIELASSVVFYWSPSAYDQTPLNTFTTQVNKTTYALTYQSTATATVGTVTTSAASTVSTANSTPTGFKYLLNSPLTTDVTPRMPTTMSPTTVTSTSCIAMSTCTLPNGKFLVAYLAATTYAVSVAVYSSTGVFEQTISIGTAHNGSVAIHLNNFKIIALTSGKFAILYISSSTVSILAVYSTSFVQTTAIGLSSAATITGTNNISIAAMSNDQIGVVYGNVGSTAYVQVLNASLAAVWSASPSPAALFTNVSIAGNDANGFAIKYYYSGATNNYVQAYVQTAATTWATNTGAISVLNSSGSALMSNQALTYFGSGQYGLITPEGAGSATTVLYETFSDSGTILAYTTGITSSDTRNYSNVGVGLTSYGNTVVAIDLGGTAGIALYAGNPKFTQDYTAGSFVIMNYPATGAGTTTAANGASTRGANQNGSWINVSPLNGNTCVVSWLNSSAYPVFAVLNCFPFNTTTTVTTSQIPTSAPVAPSLNTAPSTTSLANTFIAGIAATTATAGGTGTLITSGLAQLNTSFPSTLNQAIDSTNPVLPGVKGTIVGRVANLQGN